MTPTARRAATVDAPSAFAWMAAGAVCFGFMNFFARVSSTTHAHWTLTAAVRAAVGAAVAATAALAQGERPFVRPSSLMWQRTAFGTVSMALVFFALSDRRAPLADAVTLTNTTPVFLAVLAPIFLGEHGGRRLLLALALAAAGVLLVLRPTFLFPDAAHPPDPRAWVPELVAVAGALVSAFAMMSLRRLKSDENPEAVVVHFSSTAAVVMACAAALLSPGWPPRAAWAPMLATGLCAGFAQIFMTRAYARASAARVSALGYLAIVVSGLLGALVLHEPLSGHAALGMLSIVAGGLVVSLMGIRDRRTQ